MKKSILALFIACSTFLFTACDDPKPQVVQEEAKASEPAEPTKEMPAQSPEATSPTATETTPATEMPAQPNTNMAEPAPQENATAPATTEEPAPANAAAQYPQSENAAAAPVSVKPTNKQAAHKQELARVLSMLEKQYTQVRCVNDIKDDSGKIKMDSYCRQEEERLIREMQRVKRELAK